MREPPSWSFCGACNIPRPMTAIVVTPKTLERRYRAATKNLFDLVETRTNRLAPDGVHDVRITVRRIQVIRKLLPKRVRKVGGARRFDSDIEKLLGATSGMRDVDTVLSVLDPYREALPKELFDELVEERKTEAKGARAVMDAILRRKPPAFERTSVSRKQISSRAKRMIRKRRRAVEASMFKVLSDEGRVKELHRLRIEMREMRYVMELVKNRAEERDVLADWQEALGRIHDLDMAIACLKKRGLEQSELASRLVRQRHLGYFRFANQFGSLSHEVRRETGGPAGPLTLIPDLEDRLPR